MVCTFFGHRDAPRSIEKVLSETLERLIVAESVNCFYVGNNGNFDSMVTHSLRELMKNIRLTIGLF